MRNPNINRAALFDLSRNDRPNQEVEKMNTMQKVFLSPTSIFSLVATALLVATTAARAEATTLICHLNTNLSPFVEDQPTTVELNETQSTVIVHIGAGHHSDPYWSSPPSTIGPVQATFSADTISFPAPAGDSFTIDRLTGAMHGANGDWICQPGKALF